jgi:hypothetical protein
MCTYLTEKVGVTGSGKGPAGWFKLTDASVYFDHPVHCMAAGHTLNIDFLDPGAGPAARVAVELTAESARALAQAIMSTLDAAPSGLELPSPGPPPEPPPNVRPSCQDAPVSGNRGHGTEGCGDAVQDRAGHADRSSRLGGAGTA